MTRALVRSPFSLFALIAVGVVAASVAVVTSASYAASPGVLSAAVAADLVLVIPAVYWLLVLRRGAARWSSALPLVAVCLVVAHLVIPAGQWGVLAWLRFVVAPAELALVGYVIWRVATLMRRGHESGDLVEALRETLARPLGDGVVARFVAMELAIVAYALGVAPRVRGDDGSRVFRVTRPTALTATLCALLVLETALVHVFVARWSGVAAWTLTGLGVYSLVWIAGLHRAIGALPVVVSEEDVMVRAGLGTSVRVSYGQIEGVSRPDWRTVERPPEGWLNASAPATPNMAISFTRPLEVRRLLGRTDRVRHLGLRVEDPDGLMEAISARLGR